MPTAEILLHNPDLHHRPQLLHAYGSVHDSIFVSTSHSYIQEPMLNHREARMDALPRAMIQNTAVLSRASSQSIGSSYSAEPVFSSHRKPYDYTKLRPCYHRSRTGCLSCRSRKKKCDNAKPECMGCRRNGLTCRWPSASHVDVASPDRLGNYQRPALSASKSGRRPETLIGDGPPAVTCNIPSVRHSITSQLPCTSSSTSFVLLRHYVEHTASLLATVPLTKNPFITIIMPLAYTDHLFMSSMLAVSGAHLACKHASAKSLENSSSYSALAEAAVGHYAKVIAGIRTELANLDLQDAPALLRLLLILIMVAHYEAIAGNTTGMLRQHIRAAREFISHLLLRPKDVGVDADSLDFGLELYAYIHIVNSFTSYGPDSTRNVLDVPLVTILDNLQSCCTFKSMFDGCYSLFEFIPQVDELAKYRLREEYLFPGDSSASDVLVSRFSELQQRIEGWNLKPPRSATETEWDKMFVASEAIRSSLLIYLQTALAGSVVQSKESQETIQEHVDRALRLINATVNSRHMTLMFWPTLVVGSCVVQAAQKKYVITHLETSRFQMGHLAKASEALQLLWEDEDPRSYGPYGFNLIAEKYGLYVPIL